MQSSIFDVQDDIAKYLVCLANEPSHWYCLNGCIDDDSHLSKRFGMSSGDYQALLVASNLANVVEGKLIIQRQQWNNFLSGHHRLVLIHSETSSSSNCITRAKTKKKSDRVESESEIQPRVFELDIIKMALNGGERKDVYVIRIGRASKFSPPNFRVQRRDNIPPPRPSNALRIQQQGFRRATEVAIAHKKIEFLLNDKEIPIDDIEEDGIIIGDVGHAFLHNYHDNTVETAYTAADSISPCRITTASKETAATIKSPNQPTIPVIHNTTAELFFTDDAADRKHDPLYPMLSSIYGTKFDPCNEKMKCSMRLLLKELLHVLDASQDGLRLKDAAGHEVSYIRVPRASSDKSFNNTKYWVDEVLKINHGHNESTFESATRVMNHLIKFYRDSFFAALKKQGIATAKPMSTTQYVAMLSALGISGTKEKVLAKHLRHHLGKSFIPSQKGVSMLTEGHAPVVAKSMNWQYEQGKRAETVQWSEKDIDTEIEVQLARELNALNVKCSDVEKIRAVVGGDHGDIAFQFVAEITAVLKDKRRIKFESIISELICRTDSSALIEATILPCLTKGLKILSNQKLHIYNTEEDLLQCSFALPTTLSHPTDSTSIQIGIYVTGDLAFQAMLLGREDMSGQHCLTCQLSRTQLNNGISDGVPWTFPLIMEAGRMATQQGKAVNGVKKEPWWPFLNFQHHMVPLLHCEIGIGNNLLDKFCNIVNEFIESKTDEELVICRELTTYDQVVIETVKERDDFDDNPDKGKKLRSLQRKAQVIRKQNAQLGIDDVHGEISGDNGEDGKDDDDDDDDDIGDKDNADNNKDCGDNDELTISTTKIQKLEQQIKPLLTERSKMAAKLKQTRLCISEKRKILVQLQSLKKKTSESLETKIFEVLKEFRVELTSYHGGSLTGKDIRKVIDNATDIFEKLSPILKAGKWQNCEYDDDGIDALCKHFQQSFELWDGAFSLARMYEPSPQDAALYQSFVTAAVDRHVSLGLSITPKVHLMHKHVHWQMENIDGGLGDKMEDGIEKSHQTGKRDRGQFCTVQHLQIRAEARQRRVHRNSDPAVVAARIKVNESSKRQFTGDQSEKETIEESRMRERKEKRLKVLDEYLKRK